MIQYDYVLKAAGDVHIWAITALNNKKQSSYL